MQELPKTHLSLRTEIEPEQLEAIPQMLDVQQQQAANAAAYAAMQQRQHPVPTAQSVANVPGTVAPTPAGEPVKSVVIQIPDGREVEVGPPQGLATPYVMASILGEEKSAIAVGYTKALLYVRSIGGVEVQAPRKKVEAEYLAIQLGEQGLDHVLAAMAAFWPQVESAAQLQVVKKNLR